MIPVTDTVRRIINEQGRTQTWISKRMNEINPRIEMDLVKFNSIVTGRRKMSGDELLAFCMAMEVTPDEFLFGLPDKKGVQRK